MQGFAGKLHASCKTETQFTPCQNSILRQENGLQVLFKHCSWTHGSSFQTPQPRTAPAANDPLPTLSGSRSSEPRLSLVIGHTPVSRTYFSTSVFSNRRPLLTETTGCSGTEPLMAQNIPVTSVAASVGRRIPATRCKHALDTLYNTACDAMCFPPDQCMLLHHLLNQIRRSLRRKASTAQKVLISSGMSLLPKMGRQKLAADAGHTIRWNTQIPIAKL